MNYYSTFWLDNTRMVYSWSTTFMLLSLIKVNPFLSEIQFPIQPKPEELTEIAKWFLEQFYDTKLWDGNQMSISAKELFETTDQKLILAIGIENKSILCEWGNKLPIENTTVDDTLQVWNDIILSSFHNDMLKHYLDDKLPQRQESILQSVAVVYEDLIGVSNKIDILENSPSDEWEKHLAYLYNRGESGNKEVELIMSPFTPLWRLLQFLRIKSFLKSTKITLNSQELEVWNRFLQSESDSQNKQINIKDLNASI